MNRAAAEYARREIARHPAVQALGVLEECPEGLRLTFDLDLGFGHRWLTAGISPGGVAPVETVRFDFDAAYPGAAPEPSYRPDLGRSFPHVQPWLTWDDRPVPCLTEAPLDDFHAARGVTGLVSQFVIWLRNAAAGRLIDPVQGWEPSRRDSYADIVVTHTRALRALPDDPRLAPLGSAYLQARFCALTAKTGESHWLGEVDDTVRLDDAGLGAQTEGPLTTGRTVAVALWATGAEGERPPYFDIYAPDDVSVLGDLVRKADEFRVGRRLKFALELLTSRQPRGGSHRVLPVVVILLVRRPVHLANLDSPIEIFAYRIQLPFAGSAARLDPVIPVTRMAVRDQLSTELLRRMSGTNRPGVRWALLGAGSLGSKVGLHLSREGAPPEAVVDRSGLAPHNLARHALTPSSLPLGLGWAGYKADAVADAMRSVTRREVLSLPMEASAALATLQAVSGPPEVIVNTTAALAVRTSAVLTAAGAARWIDGEMFDRAALGVLRTEGPERNPNVEELAGAGYVIAYRDPKLAPHVFEAGLSIVALGEGCGSATMVANDASVSVQAALIAEAISGHLAAMPQTGLIETWRREGGGAAYDRAVVAPFVRVDLGDGWSLSLSGAVAGAIDTDIAAWPRVETGGALIGRVSLTTRTVYALEVIPAPPDSRRLPTFFELGVAGLDDTITAWTAGTGGALYCVGTWHSHLGPAAPSGIDRATAGRLGDHSPYPLALLIRGRDGYSGVLAAIKEDPQ